MRLIKGASAMPKQMDLTKFDPIRYTSVNAVTLSTGYSPQRKSVLFACNGVLRKTSFFLAIRFLVIYSRFPSACKSFPDAFVTQLKYSIQIWNTHQFTRQGDSEMNTGLLRMIIIKRNFLLHESCQSWWWVLWASTIRNVSTLSQDWTGIYVGRSFMGRLLRPDAVYRALLSSAAKNFSQIFALRFFLGIFESAMLPGVVSLVYLTVL